MSNKATRTSRKRLWLIACLAMPFIYALSVGPFMWTMAFLLKRMPVMGLVTFTTVVTAIAYAPLGWIAKCLGLEELLDWYVRLLI